MPRHTVYGNPRRVSTATWWQGVRHRCAGADVVRTAMPLCLKRCPLASPSHPVGRRVSLWANRKPTHAGGCPRRHSY